jgi:putative inorganic carbon (HCO3(-)) transporter
VIVVGLAWYRSFLTVAVAAVVALVAIPLLAPSGLFARVDELGQLRGGTAQVSDPAVLGRFSEMRSAYDMFADHPIVGIGTGGYPTLYPEYASRLGIENSATDRNAHSLFLQQAAETGAIGLLQLFSVLGLMWVALRRTAREADRTSASLAEGVTLAVLGFLAAGLFLHLAYPQYFWCLVGLGLASSQTIPRTTASSSSSSPSPGEPALALGRG